MNLERIDWGRIGADLDARGCATTGPILGDAECDALIATYDDDARFRSRVVMARHNYRQGEYRYFAYPLPDTVAGLRAALYPKLAEIANRWEGGFPADHAAYLARCREAGQTRPTPLILKYGAGDYNRLHQDLYGDEVFPIQATVLLSAPGEDFTGGEFILVEQRPRQQSRAEVVPLSQGDAVIFAVHHRPQRGTRGFFRVTMRHGVSRVRSGNRMTLGIIFHDAA